MTSLEDTCQERTRAPRNLQGLFRLLTPRETAMIWCSAIQGWCGTFTNLTLMYRDELGSHSFNLILSTVCHNNQPKTMKVKTHIGYDMTDILGCLLHTFMTVSKLMDKNKTNHVSVHLNKTLKSYICFVSYWIFDLIKIIWPSPVVKPEWEQSSSSFSSIRWNRTSTEHPRMCSNQTCNAWAIKRLLNQSTERLHKPVSVSRILPINL